VSAAAPHPAPPAGGRLTGLDGVRAVAVGLVMVAHFVPPAAVPGLAGVVKRSVFGVEIFFVLSGFLITHLLLREEAATGRVHLGLFYARRAVRILPPVVAYLAALYAADRAGLVAVPGVDFLAGLFFARNFVGSAPETAHLWSLAIEEQFYLVWPAALVLLPWTWARVAVCAAVVAGTPLWIHAYTAWAGGPDHVNYMRTDFRLGPIMTGALLAVAGATRAGRRVLASRPATATPTAAAALLLFAAAVFTDALDGRGVRAFKEPIACGCVAVLLNHVTRRPAAPLTRVLDLGPVAWVGRLSYSLYLWQQVFAPNGTGPAWFREFPIGLLGAVGCAAASYYLLERPLLALRSRFRREAGAPP
jgi:peptidoglycan/LPS O-acetylase OafA/YrhL